MPNNIVLSDGQMFESKPDQKNNSLRKLITSPVLEIEKLNEEEYDEDESRDLQTCLINDFQNQQQSSNNIFNHSVIQVDYSSQENI